MATRATRAFVPHSRGRRPELLRRAHRCFPGTSSPRLFHWKMSSSPRTPRRRATCAFWAGPPIVTVQHGVDATALGDRFEAGRFDHVIFNHPHLGLDDLHQTELHAQRHRAHSPFFGQRYQGLQDRWAHSPRALWTSTGQRLVEEALAEGCLQLVHIMSATHQKAIEVGRFVICSGVPPKLSGNAENVFAIYTRWVYMVMSIGGHGDADIARGAETVLTWCGRR